MLQATPPYEQNLITLHMRRICMQSLRIWFNHFREEDLTNIKPSFFAYDQLLFENTVADDVLVC